MNEKVKIKIENINNIIILYILTSKIMNIDKIEILVKPLDKTINTQICDIVKYCLNSIKCNNKCDDFNAIYDVDNKHIECNEYNEYNFLKEKYNDVIIFEIYLQKIINLDKEQLKELINKYVDDFLIDKLHVYSIEIIVIVICDDYVNNNKIVNNFIKTLFSATQQYILYQNIQINVNFCKIYIDKINQYLYLLNNLTNNLTNNLINGLIDINYDIIDIILIEELGKQKFKKICSNEKKIENILNIINDTNIINEWLDVTGLNNFINILKINVVEQKSKFIKNHVQIELFNTINNIKLNIENLQMHSNDKDSFYFIFSIIEFLQNINEMCNFNKINDNVINKNINNKNIVGNNDVGNSNVDNKIIQHLHCIINDILTNIKLFNFSCIYDNADMDYYLKYITIFINTFLPIYICIFTSTSTSETLKIIKNKKNELIKQKLMLSFDENLFIDLLENKTIDFDFFKQCINYCLDSDINNIIKLLNFSIKYSYDSFNIIINEFIINNFDKCTHDINDKCMCEIIELVMKHGNKINHIQSNDEYINSQNNYSYVDTIMLSNLIYKIIYLHYSDDIYNHINNVIMSSFIFNQYLSVINQKYSDFYRYGQIKVMLYMNNLYYNYNSIVQKLIQDYSVNNYQSNNNDFETEYIYVTKLISIIFEHVISYYFECQKNNKFNSNVNGYKHLTIDSTKKMSNSYYFNTNNSNNSQQGIRNLQNIQSVQNIQNQHILNKFINIDTDSSEDEDDEEDEDEDEEDEDEEEDETNSDNAENENDNDETENEEENETNSDNGENDNDETNDEEEDETNSDNNENDENDNDKTENDETKNDETENDNNDNDEICNNITIVKNDNNTNNNNNKTHNFENTSINTDIIHIKEANKDATNNNNYAKLSDESQIEQIHIHMKKILHKRHLNKKIYKIMAKTYYENNNNNVDDAIKEFQNDVEIKQFGKKYNVLYEQYKNTK